MNKETALILAKTRIQEYLASQFGVKQINKNFRCLNPTHDDKNPSMSYDNRRYKVHCFSCNADYDIFDLYAIKNNLTPNSKEVFEGVYNWLGISIDKTKSDNSFLQEKTMMNRNASVMKAKSFFVMVFCLGTKAISDCTRNVFSELIFL